MSTTLSEDSPSIESRMDQFHASFEELRSVVSEVVLGQEDIVEKTLIAILAGGHVLLEGVPGLGKTLLVKTIAQALGLEFSRVQFTPDLMPADLVGTKIFIEDQEGGSRFEFTKGPLFTNLLIGDEINRATPKTQSALLEAMQERTVTVAGETHILPKPFFVLATQNPLEQEGTYPLPEAQLDRFFFKLQVGFPSAESLAHILTLTTGVKEPVVRKLEGAKMLLDMGKMAREVPVPDTVLQRTVELVMGSHPEQPMAPEAVRKYVRFGASPRAGQACLIGAKIRALLQRRTHVATEDILAIAPSVFNHRILLNFEAQADGVSGMDMANTLVKHYGNCWA